MYASRIAVVACLAFAACASSQKPLGPPPFALTAHDANADASVRVDFERGYGSGVVVSKDGLIVTSEHVVRYAVGQTVSAAITRPDGVEVRSKVEIVAKDPARDLALLRIVGPSETHAASLAEAEEIRAGDPIYSIGYPGRRGPVTSWGTVVTVPFSVDMRPAEPADFKDGILAALPAEEGSSGQGVFSATSGKLIAIHKLSLSTITGDGTKSVLVSVAEIRRFLEANGISLP